MDINYVLSKLVQLEGLTIVVKNGAFVFQYDGFTYDTSALILRYEEAFAEAMQWFRAPKICKMQEELRNTHETNELKYK